MEWGSWFCRHHIRIRPKEPLSIKVDHVFRIFGDPDFGFPRNVGDEGLHPATVLEGGDEDQACFATGE